LEAVIAAWLKRPLASSGFRYAVTAVIGIRHAQRLGTVEGGKNGGDSEETTPAAHYMDGPPRQTTRPISWKSSVFSDSVAERDEFELSVPVR
jgi:hypothetical protein